MQRVARRSNKQQMQISLLFYKIIFLLFISSWKIKKKVLQLFNFINALLKKKPLNEPVIIHHFWTRFLINSKSMLKHKWNIYESYFRRNVVVFLLFPKNSMKHSSRMPRNFAENSKCPANPTNAHQKNRDDVFGKEIEGKIDGKTKKRHE